MRILPNTEWILIFKNILTREEFKNSWHQCTQKLLFRLSDIVKWFKLRDRKDITENQTALDMDLKLTEYKNDTDKIVIQDL